jgi:serine/threonine protein kinase
VIEKHPYQEEVDNWTLGVLMFILLSGYHPFDVYGDLPEPKLLKNVRSGRFDFNDEAWNDISEAPKELIRKLLKVDAKERMSLKDFLKSEWISSEGGSKNKQLDKTLERMQRFNAIRKKFRGIVLMIAASERMRRLSMNSKMEREGSLSINHKNGSKPSSKAGSFSGDVSNTARLSEAEIIKKALAGLEPGELSGPSSPTERKGGLRSPNTLGLRRASSPTPSELNTVTEGSEVPATVDIN